MCHPVPTAMPDFACQFIAETTAKNRFFGEVGDAIIVFYVRCATKAEAERKLTAMVAREGWRPVRPTRHDTTWHRLKPPPRPDAAVESNLREIGEHARILGEPPADNALFSMD